MAAARDVPDFPVKIHDAACQSPSHGLVKKNMTASVNSIAPQQTGPRERGGTSNSVPYFPMLRKRQSVPDFLQNLTPVLFVPDSLQNLAMVPHVPDFL